MIHRPNNIIIIVCFTKLALNTETILQKKTHRKRRVGKQKQAYRATDAHLSYRKQQGQLDNEMYKQTSSELCRARPSKELTTIYRELATAKLAAGHAENAVSARSTQLISDTTSHC